MKKLFLTLILFLCLSFSAFAQDINIDGETFTLKFAKYNNNDNYINEYVRPSETLYNWKDIITVFYFPNLTSINGYMNMLKIIENQENSFMITKSDIDRTLSWVMIVHLENNIVLYEYNTMKFQQEIKGTKTIQWGKRLFSKKDKKEIKNTLATIDKLDKNCSAILKSTPIPEIYTKDFEKK